MDKKINNLEKAINYRPSIDKFNFIVPNDENEKENYNYLFVIYLSFFSLAK